MTTSAVHRAMPWGLRFGFVGFIVAAMPGCILDDGSSAGPTSPRVGEPTAELLPVVQVGDPDRAEHGRRFLHEDGLGGQQLPMLALRNLGWVWSETYASDREYWDAFAERYGFTRDPNVELPLGIEDHGAQAGFNCLACHSDEVAGEVVIGAGNSRLDLQRLYDDLVRLNELAAAAGFPRYPVAYELENHTGAPGAYDAFGLSFQLATAWVGNPGVNTEFGYQQPPAWWTLKYKQEMYADGSGDPRGFRTMMATTLAFGQDLSDLADQAEDYEDLRHYLLSLSSPGWPFDPPASEDVTAGRAVFNDQCARCHGTYGGHAANYPDRMVDLDDIGTDPVRAQRFGEPEAEFVNQSWFGADYPMQATGRYLAPPLIGVWATAPYLHNGSVPDLVGVLDSIQRPARFRRIGSARDDYDAERVGWRVDTSAPESDVDFVTDTPGLSAAGHTYGDSLSAEERRVLLSYLVTL